MITSFIIKTLVQHPISGFWDPLKKQMSFVHNFLQIETFDGQGRGGSLRAGDTQIQELKKKKVICLEELKPARFPKAPPWLYGNSLQFWGSRPAAEETL